MQAAETHPGHVLYRRTIRRPRSLSRTALIALFAGYAVVATLFSGLFWFVGAWPVMPFMGLEVAVLGAVVIWVRRGARDYELVLVDEAEVRVLRRDGRRRSCHAFQRYWARAWLTDRGWYPSRLWIGSHGRAVRVGEWMREGERRALATDLKSLLRR